MIRPIEREDIPALAALEAASFPDPWTEGGLGMLLPPPYGGLCAVSDGVVVGYVSWMHIPAGDGMAAEAEVLRIAVSPEARRRGLGRALLGGMLDTLRVGDEPLHIYLDVRASNTAAQRLYESYGFVRRGIRPRFYGNEDALEYGLEL